MTVVPARLELEMAETRFNVSVTGPGKEVGRKVPVIPLTPRPLEANCDPLIVVVVVSKSVFPDGVYSERRARPDSSRCFWSGTGAESLKVSRTEARLVQRPVSDVNQFEMGRDK